MQTSSLFSLETIYSHPTSPKGKAIGFIFPNLFLYTPKGKTLPP